MATELSGGLDITELDPAVQYFCSKGIADSTQKTYQSTLCKFAHFCSIYSLISPFPVKEPVLCYFSLYLACQHLSPQTVKTYLAAVRHMQITLGLPKPREFLSLSCLKLVQSGIRRSYRESGKAPKIRPSNFTETKNALTSKIIRPNIMQQQHYASMASSKQVKLLSLALQLLMTKTILVGVM